MGIVKHKAPGRMLQASRCRRSIRWSHGTISTQNKSNLIPNVLTNFIGPFLPAQVYSDFAELFEGGFKVIDDFLGENTGIGKIIGFLETFAIS